MNIKRMILLLTALTLTALLAGCGANDPTPEDTSAPAAADGGMLSEEEVLAQGAAIERFDEEEEDADAADTAGLFRPVDCGLQAQELYEYPFIGLNLELTDGMRKYMDSREVFVLQDEGYTEDLSIDYAVLRFYTTTQEQRSRTVSSLDLLAWEEELQNLGALGVYAKERVDSLEELTGCDTHTRLGESADGAYQYYLSTNSAGDASLAQELQATRVTLTDMRSMDLEYGDSAFAIGRVEDVATVGQFTTQDVFGETWTQDLFADYDLTLVNAFATWCSPCVQEMPELEQLRQAFQEKGVRFNVVGVVLDARNGSSLDENAIEQAKLLHEKTGVQFPYLIPDEGEMNGRVKGLAAVPESFFVDSEGRIVSDAYLGARSQDAWAQIVEAELTRLEAAQ